jgi:sortase A
MADRRTVDELTLDELEQLVLVRRRQLRQQRVRQLAAQGRLVDTSPLLQEATSTPRSSQCHTTLPEARRLQSANPHPSPEKVPSASFTTGGSSRTRRRQLRDRLLLAIEVLALFGLLSVLISSYDNLRTLNQEVVMARAAPQEVRPPTPTPVINFGRLPGGHTPPGSAGGALPDVPVHLQQWVQPAPAQPVPTPSAAHPTRIVIPSIGVDAPVVEGVTWDDLKKGAGHLPGSANPGERGNVYLAAHNDIFGEIFRYLDQLELGDEFFIYGGNRSFRYTVTSKRITAATDVSVMYASTEPIATLQTCYPYLVDTERLVVIGELAR